MLQQAIDLYRSPTVLSQSKRQDLAYPTQRRVVVLSDSRNERQPLSLLAADIDSESACYCHPTF
jgi:hypothetical protein